MRSTTRTLGQLAETADGRERWADTHRYHFALYVSALLGPLVLIAAVAAQPWVPPADLLRDPLAVATSTNDCCHAYQGSVSNLGVLLWWAATAVCCFAGLLVLTGERRKEAGFLGAAAAFTALLTLDDLFLVHDNVLPRLGVPQVGAAATYAALGLAYLWRFRTVILAMDYPVLIAAGAALGASVIVDQVVHSDAAWRILVEDGAKLLGISLWSAFHLVAAFRLVFARGGLAGHADTPVRINRWRRTAELVPTKAGSRAVFSTVRSGPPAVLLLGNYRPTLSIARNLASAGYRVIVTAKGGEGGSEYSRFVSGIWDDPGAEADPLAFAKALAQYLDRCPDIAVVFPVSEAYVEAIARHRHLLPPDRVYATPADGTVLACLDKLALLRVAQSAGAPVATFQTASTYGELLQAAAGIRYPLALRSLDPPGRRIGDSKAILADNERQLRQALPGWPRGHSRLLLQRKVGGARHNLYFAARGGVIIGAVETIILRTDHTNGSGLAVAGQTVAVTPQLLGWTEAVTRRLDYHGVGCAQFKVDAGTGTATLLEINPRVTGSHAVPEGAGLALSRMAIDLAQHAVPETELVMGAAGLRYSWTYGELRAIKTALTAGELSTGHAARRLIRAAATLLRSDIRMTWRWDDPLPTLVLFARHLAPTSLRPPDCQRQATASSS